MCYINYNVGVVTVDVKLFTENVAIELCVCWTVTNIFMQSKELTATLPLSAGRQKKVKFAMNLNKSQGMLNDTGYYWLYLHDEPR